MMQAVKLKPNAPHGLNQFDEMTSLFGCSKEWGAGFLLISLLSVVPQIVHALVEIGKMVLFQT